MKTVVATAVISSGITAAVFFGINNNTPTEERQEVNVETNSEAMDSLKKENTKLRTDLRNLNSELEAKNDDIEILRDNIKELKALLKAKNTEDKKVAKKVKDKLADDDKNLTEEEKRRKFMKSMAKMWLENPQMQKQLKNQQMKKNLARYKGLFDKMELSEEKRKEMAEMISDRNMKIMALFIDQMDHIDMQKGEFTDEKIERNTMVALKDLLDDADDQFKDTLGKDFDDFNNFDRSIEANNKLKAFETSLGEDNSLSEDQKSQMVKLLREDSESVFYSIIDGEKIQKEDANTSLSKSTSNVLTEEQQKKFNEFIKAPRFRKSWWD